MSDPLASPLELLKNKDFKGLVKKLEKCFYPAYFSTLKPGQAAVFDINLNRSPISDNGDYFGKVSFNTGSTQHVSIVQVSGGFDGQPRFIRIWVPAVGDYEMHLRRHLYSLEVLNRGLEFDLPRLGNERSIEALGTMYYMAMTDYDVKSILAELLKTPNIPKDLQYPCAVSLNDKGDPVFSHWSEFTDFGNKIRQWGRERGLK